MNIPIGGGSMHVKVRRRQIMEVGNMEGEDEDNHEDVVGGRSSMGRVKMTEHQ